jgi:hypothetical protein
MQREESKLREKLAKLDPAAAKDLLTADERLTVSLDAGNQLNALQNNYSPHLDSMQTMLKFLQGGGALDAKSAARGRLNAVFKDYEKLQLRLNKTHSVETILSERQQQLQRKFEQLGLTKQLRRYQKQFYYYRAQVQEYKNLWENPSKLESKLLHAANKLPAFQRFFAQHSQLAAIFRLPGADPMTTTQLQGLQTRDLIMQELVAKLGINGFDPNQVVANGIGDAQSQMQSLKDRIGDRIKESSNGGSELEMPCFKPNMQKSKTFLQRLEIGTNIQNTKGNIFLPTSSDVGLSVGYRLNDKSVIGLGTSYRVGWGRDIRRMQMTHEGIGLRSFLDYKYKGNIWISGGSEFNYVHRFASINALKNYSAWQASALLGVTAKYKVKRMNGKMQLLYDFLYSRQVPKSQPFIFRFGYGLK